jgi:hypothetical protein
LPIDRQLEAKQRPELCSLQQGMVFVERRAKIGDFSYYGLGGSSPNFEHAAHHYN